jgi:hypothetical protein
MDIVVGLLMLLLVLSTSSYLFCLLYEHWQNKRKSSGHG